jgi:hypothetical protein
MKSFGRPTTMLVCMLLITGFLSSCGKPKEGKVVITDQEFSIRQDSKHTWAIDAKGKIKNVGEADVKNIVVTGYCKSCGEIVISGSWFYSAVEKRDEQKAVIAYLPVGAEEDFSFKDIAFLMDQTGKVPEKTPDGVACQIVSFETVQK